MAHWGIYSYAACVDGLVVCLAELRDAYDTKGSDSNYEAGVELRRSAAISLKRPFKTVLHVEVCFRFTLVVNMSMFISRHNFGR